MRCSHVPGSPVARLGAVVFFGISLTLPVTLGDGARDSAMQGEWTSPVVSSDGVVRLSERTIEVAFELDRDAARVAAYTVKPRPFARVPLLGEVRAFDGRGRLQVEVSLLGPLGARYVQRMEAGVVCLHHGPGEPPHPWGDATVPHRAAWVIDLPELAGFDRVEVAYHATQEKGPLERRVLGTESLTHARFTRAGGKVAYVDLAFAAGGDPKRAEVSKAGGPPAGGTIYWPEDYNDPDLYRVLGDEAETNQRVNVVILPDGYTYAQKPLMEAHFEALVGAFRNKTPWAQHDRLVNYVLVYAYSEQSEISQCDCNVIHDTAFSTYFPEVVDTCGDAANRCVFTVGDGCVGGGAENIVEAELRAPALDTTILMAHSPRHGGCGGSRAVYTTGPTGAGIYAQTGIHEVGHSHAGLDDEYWQIWACGGSASELNTSLDSVEGAWPEWIGDLGAPREGGAGYAYCVYRPEMTCAMSDSSSPFCAVCSQHLTLMFYDNPRVAPTAPIESAEPGKEAEFFAGPPVEFRIYTRAGEGDGVTHETTWTVRGPGDLEPVEVASGVSSYRHAFLAEGSHEVEVRFVADTNFVKPERWGPNVDTRNWMAEITQWLPPWEVSPPGSPETLRFHDGTLLRWEPATENGAETFRVYRGVVSALHNGGYGGCRFAGLGANQTTEPGSPAPGEGWFFLVTGHNPAGEGPLGTSSAGLPRVPDAPCD